MEKLKKAIVRYEAARQRVISIDDTRRDLFAKCTGTELDDTGKKTCSEACWSYYTSEDNLVNYSGFHLQHESEYDEIMSEHGCQNCVSAREVKKGELAAAKKEFGIAKRQLSAIGKVLIKESLSTK